MKYDIRHFIELLWGMTERELRARYKYTIFGFFWLVLNPLLQMLVIGFIFTSFMKEPIEHYYFFLFSGLLVWNFFSLSLSKITPSIVNERSLIKKAKFPHAIIPLSIALSNFIHFSLAFLLFLVPIIYLNTFSLYSLPYMILALVLLITFTSGLGLLTSALNVRFRDVNFFVQAIMIVWFYASPIIYSLNMLPNHIRWLWHMNPLTSILMLIREALLKQTGPEPSILIANVIIIVLIFWIGTATFQKESKYFDDWL